MSEVRQEAEDGEVVEGSRGSYRLGGPEKLLDGSGFHPPAVVLIACTLAGVGGLFLVAGTPALKLPGVARLPAGATLVKLLLAAMLLGTGLGLYRLDRWALPAARLLILIGGVLVPLYPFQSRYIDWEFMVTGRFMLGLTSLVVLGYLNRSSVAHAFAHRGVPVRYEGYYCAGCNSPHASHRFEGCPQCGGPLHRLYRAPGGVAHAPFLDGTLCRSCGEETAIPRGDCCPVCGKTDRVLLFRFPGGAGLAVEV